MTELTKYTPGQFSWVDLMAPDPLAAKDFYGALFGWGCVDNPTDQGGVYTQFTLRGKNVAGMGEMSDEMKQVGLPPIWSSYVSVDDADATAARVAEIGGEIPKDHVGPAAGGRHAAQGVAARAQSDAPETSGRRAARLVADLDIGGVRVLVVHDEPDRRRTRGGTWAVAVR